MAMDLDSIRDINGPQRERLQKERAEIVARNHHDARQAQRAHGDRVAARSAVNGQPFKD